MLNANLDELTTTDNNNSAAEISGIKAKPLKECIIEIVSDAGEGAQKAGQSFGSVSAKMGNGVWTVEIIPAEVQPPARSRAGASGIRIRFGSNKITNMGDERIWLLPSMSRCFMDE